jgi:hypothetical protein
MIAWAQILRHCCLRVCDMRVCDMRVCDARFPEAMLSLLLCVQRALSGPHCHPAPISERAR